MAEAKLHPVTRAFDEDTREAQKRGSGYSFAMRGAEEKAEEYGAKWEDAAEGWKAVPPVSDAGIGPQFAGASGLVTVGAFGGASTLKSIWGSGGFSGGLVTLDLAGRARITSPFAQDPTYYACLDKLSKAIGALPIRLEREVVEDGEPKWVPVSQYGDAGSRRSGGTPSRFKADAAEQALMDLLNRPSPIHTGRSFRTAFVQHFVNDGEVLLMLMGEGQEAINQSPALDARIAEIPKYLWPVGGDMVQPLVEDRVGSMPRRFSLSDGQTWPAGSAAWCIMVTPDSATRGMGPLSAVRRKLEQNYQIDRFGDALLRNGGMPGGFFYTPDRLDRNQKRGIQQSWAETHGGAGNTGKIAVIDGGAKFEPATFKPAEMQFAELQTKNDEYVRMVMGATKPVLGITDDVNRANAHEAMRVWYEVTVKPLADLILDQLNNLFISRLDPLKKGGRHRLCFDYSGVPFLRDDLDSKVKRATQIAESFGLSPRDAMKLANWMEGSESDAEGLDERWIKTDRKPLEVALDPESYKPSDGVAGAATPAKAVAKAVEDEDGGDDAEAVRELERRKFMVWKAHDDLIAKREKPLKREVEAIQTSYVLAARKRLVEIAEGKRAVESPAAARLRARARERGEPVRKYVANEAEIERALALNLAEWTKLMQDKALPELVGTIEAAAEALHLEVSGEGAILTVTDPAVVQFMAEKEVTLVEGATSNLAKDVQRKIVKVLAGAEDATSLSDAVREVLDELRDEMQVMIEQTGARAELIARTETASSASFARTEQMGLDGINRHTWISSRDGSVRDSHDSLDGKTVGVGEVFGYGLAYPGDGSHGASAAEICNCRCTTLPELE